MIAEFLATSFCRKGLGSPGWKNENMDLGQLSPEFTRALVQLLFEHGKSLEHPELCALHHKYRESEELQDALRLWVEGLSDDEVSQITLDVVVSRMEEVLGDRHFDSHQLVQIEGLVQLGLEDGWTDNLEGLFSHLRQTAEGQLRDYESFRIEEREWTIESFVGDLLLRNGLNLYSDSLGDLVDAVRSQDEQTTEEAIDWLGEAFFYLDAAREWSRNPWI